MWAQGNHKHPYKRKVGESEAENDQVGVIKKGVWVKENGQPLEAGEGKEMILP